MRFIIEFRFTLRGWKWVGIDTLSGQVVTKGSWVSVSSIVREMNENLPGRLTQKELDEGSEHRVPMGPKRRLFWKARKVLELEQ